MIVATQVREARELRARLMNPPNARPDTGIDMRNGWPVPKAVAIPILSLHEAQDVPIVVAEPQGPNLNDIHEGISRLCRERDALDIQLDALMKKYSYVSKHSARPSVEHIQRVIAREYSVCVVDMLSARRTANIVRPRQVAMYFCKTLTLRSFPEIGRRFGNRDHTTIMHAVRKLERMIANDAMFAGDIERMKHTIARPETENV